MTEERTRPKSGGSVTAGSGRDRSVADRVSSNRATHPVSSESEAIIREVSLRRRTAMKVLADR